MSGSIQLPQPWLTESFQCLEPHIAADLIDEDCYQRGAGTGEEVELCPEFLSWPPLNLQYHPISLEESVVIETVMTHSPRNV